MLTRKAFILISVTFFPLFVHQVLRRVFQEEVEPLRKQILELQFAVQVLNDFVESEEDDFDHGQHNR